VKQANGNLAVMLINKDPNNSYATNVSLSGYTPTSTATQYFYGETSSAITSSSVNTGSSFSVTVPPYSLTTIVMAPAPTFTATASASPSTISAGATGTITASFKDTGGAASNLVTDIEVYNSAGSKVAQQTYSGQNFTAGGTDTNNWSWTAPTTPGTYTVSLGVFNSTWNTLYYWGSNTATITVAAPDTAQYNFETGTQSWASSGGPITGISSATTQAFAGTHSLAVSFNSTTASAPLVYVSAPSTAAGKVVTFHVWIPSGSAITSMQVYVQAGNRTWTTNWQPIGNLKTNAWNTLAVTVPSNAVTPLGALGVQFGISGAWTGTCYVDSVSW